MTLSLNKEDLVTAVTQNHVMSHWSLIPILVNVNVSGWIVSFHKYFMRKLVSVNVKRIRSVTAYTFGIMIHVSVIAS